MRRRTSDIPPEAEERLLSEYRSEFGEKGGVIFPEVRECVLNGQVVGRRAYNANGNLWIETPMKDGNKHGREYVWYEDGSLESVEPYFEGKLHGLAKQYGRNGRVIGTYRFVHGTGYDIWRQERGDGSIYISEIHSMRDSRRHGYEWWLRSDQRSVWHERHWQEGKSHGIERMWNKENRLKRGYPKYWIQGQAVKKRAYMKAAERDETLPAFREKDNRPRRKFPTEIEKLLS